MSERAPETPFDQLVAAILDDPGIADGDLPAPSRASDDEVAEALSAVYVEHGRAAAHLPVLAAELQRTVACGRGCNTCCNELVLVTRGEAQLVAAELRKPERAAALADFRVRAPAWLAASQLGAVRAATAFANGDLEGYRVARRQHALAQRMCPLNHDGDCTVYEARPLVCRQAWVVDSATLCGPAPEGVPQAPAAVLTYPAYEELLRMAGQLAAGLQASQDVPARQRESLVAAVLAALEDGQRGG